MGIGLNQTTEVKYQKAADGRIGARCGIALFGSTNMTKQQMDSCDNNPFHPDWYDNIVRGFGATEEEAFAALQKDANELSESLWD